MRTFPILFALFIAPFVIASDNYNTYTNERYGYSIAYPADFRPQGVSDSGDGQVFVSPNGDAELRVFASACVDGVNSTPKQYLANYEKKQKSKRLTLSYQRAGSNFAVVSGHRKDQIFYNKIIVNNDWCAELSFQYGEDKASQYDAVTNRISSSLKR
jgi:hypothetical protein